ncbi:MAG: hypothetical protein JXJ20_02160 [Anaerolineae bacterium]|nr:hypothetical protein [Anaerolineae bacterium]
MKKWGLLVMLAAMLAAPMLACGFPLPAGTQTMDVSKAICAATETADTCQARQDAYQLMDSLQSAVIPDLEMSLYIDTEGEVTEVTLKGSYEYVLADSDEGLGANIHAMFTEGELVSPQMTESLAGWEVVVIGSKGYTSKDGGATWVVEDLGGDALLGVGVMLGLGGAEASGFDIFSDPGIFTVTVGADQEYEGQPLQVQTLAVDLGGMLGSVDALMGMMDSGSSLTGMLGMGEEETADLGLDEITPEDLAMVSAMLLPMLQGTEFSTTIHIGKNDGYIYYIADNYVLALDSSAFDPEAQPMAMRYTLAGHITQHNAALTITEPTSATEGAGLFGDSGGLFGGGGE